MGKEIGHEEFGERDYARFAERLEENLATLGQLLERLGQETTSEELLVSRDELARIVREQVEAALRRAS